MPNFTLFKKTVSLISLALATGATSLSIPTPASANSSCYSYVACGTVSNTTSVPVRASKNWCWSNQTRYSGEVLPCERHGNSYIVSPHSGSTPFVDIDAFRARGGCVTSWVTILKLGSGNTPIVRFSADRRGRGSQWIKVPGGDIAFIDRTC
jgi:hypothetical protein